MATWPFNLHLDRKICLTGSHAAGTTTWTLPFSDATIDKAVLSSDFGAAAGTVIDLTRPNATEATASGDYSAGVAMLGRSYDCTLELTPPWVRDYGGVGLTNGATYHKKLEVRHQDAIQYSAKAVYPNTTDRTSTFDVGSTTPQEEGFLSAPHFMGDVRSLTMTVENVSPYPATIVSAWHTVDYEPRLSTR
jgi:hypothetical protein